MRSKRRARHALDGAEEDVDDDEEDERVRVVADEGRAEPAEDDVDGDTDREQEACGDNVHARERVHGRCAANCVEVKSVSDRAEE